MNYTYSFEKLDVWNESTDLVVEIYSITKLYPDIERFGLTIQLRRASISIVSNIAEGSGRSSFKDQAHFYQLAYSSLHEVLAQLIVSSKLGYIHSETLQNLRNQIEKISKKLNGLRKSCYR